VIEAGAIDLPRLDASTNPDGTTMPVILAGAFIMIGKLDLLERVGIDSKTSPSRRTTHEIVSSVANDETDVMQLRKEHTGLDVEGVLRHDYVAGEEPDCALWCWVGSGRSSSGSGRGVASNVRPECPKVRNGLIGSTGE
jgi:hypothetical protein